MTWTLLGETRACDDKEVTDVNERIGGVFEFYTKALVVASLIVTRQGISLSLFMY